MHLKRQNVHLTLDNFEGYKVELQSVLDYLGSLYPGRHIKIGTFRTERIGHFISETDEVINTLKNQISDNSSILNILFMPEQVCNEQIRVMYKRLFSSMPHVELIDCRNSALGRMLLPIVKLFTAYIHQNKTNHPNFCGPLLDGGIDSVPSSLKLNRPFISFTAEEIEYGWQELKKFGITPETKYVTLHHRDAAYLDQTLGSAYAYHNYRNPPADIYIHTVNKLISLGYKVIRMGNIVEKAFPYSHPNFTDYSVSEHKNDFLDVFLFSNCFAHIGCSSGIDLLGVTFNKPVAVVNIIPAVRQVTYITSYVEFSCASLIKGDRLLSPEETLQYPLWQAHEYEENGLTIVFNDPLKIWDTVERLLKKLSPPCLSSSYASNSREDLLYREAMSFK